MVRERMVGVVVVVVVLGRDSGTDGGRGLLAVPAANECGIGRSKERKLVVVAARHLAKNDKEVKDYWQIKEGTLRATAGAGLRGQCETDGWRERKRERGGKRELK